MHSARPGLPPAESDLATSSTDAQEGQLKSDIFMKLSYTLFGRANCFGSMRHNKDASVGGSLFSVASLMSVAVIKPRRAVQNRPRRFCLLELCQLSSRSLNSKIPLPGATCGPPFLLHRVMARSRSVHCPQQHQLRRKRGAISFPHRPFRHLLPVFDVRRCR